MNTTELYENFCNYLKVRDFSHYYKAYLLVFLNHCDDMGIDPLNITYQQVSDFIIKMKDKGLDPGSVNNYIKAVKAFYNFLAESGLKLVTDELRNMVCSFRQMKVEQKIRPYLTLKEVDMIISDAITYSYSMSPEKIQAILYFMYFTGLRKQELVNLKRTDIDLNERQVIVRKRKNKEELISFFTKEVAKLLENYFAVEMEVNNAFNMTIAKFDHFFRFLKNFVPEGKNIFPHMMRHSFGNMLARRKIDSRVAQKLFGHKSIHSTLIYYDPDTETVKDIYRGEIG